MEVLNQGVMFGGLRPPILKFSFHVGDVWFCGFYSSLPLNGELWPGGMSGGLCPVTTWSTIALTSVNDDSIAIIIHQCLVYQNSIFFYS